MQHIPQAKSADLLAASMAPEPFPPHTCEQVLVGLESGIKRAAVSQRMTKTDVLSSYVSSVEIYGVLPWNSSNKIQCI